MIDIEYQDMIDRINFYDDETIEDQMELEFQIQNYQGDLDD